MRCAAAPSARQTTRQGSSRSNPSSRARAPVVLLETSDGLVVLWFDGLDLTRTDGSVTQVHLMLIATTPLTGRMLVWALAPSATLSQEPATPMTDKTCATKYQPTP